MEVLDGNEFKGTLFRTLKIPQQVIAFWHHTIIVVNFIRKIKYQLTRGTITKKANINFPCSLLAQKGVSDWVSAGQVFVAKGYW